MYFMNWPQLLMCQLQPLRHVARNFLSGRLSYGETGFYREPHPKVESNAYAEQPYDVRATPGDGTDFTVGDVPERVDEGARILCFLDPASEQRDVCAILFGIGNQFVGIVGRACRTAKNANDD